MANPIVLASMLARHVAITCPHCGHRTSVDRRPVAYRMCPKCHRRFPDPVKRR